MKKQLGAMLAGLALFGGVAVACDEDPEVNTPDVNTEQVQNRANEVASNVKESSKNAWASISTDGNRLIDSVQTRNDAGAKQDLLNNCRHVEEKMRKEHVSGSRQVNDFCDDIR